jgi:hypothetical protein
MCIDEWCIRWYADAPSVALAISLTMLFREFQTADFTFHTRT